jgi:ribonuclease D
LPSRYEASTPPLLETQGEIDGLIDEARSKGFLGLDTEFLREKTYRARLCLVQVSTRSSLYLIDPLAHDMAWLAELIADPDIEVVVHAGRQDFEIFYEGWGAVPSNVFDVQLAAGFAGYGASLPYGRLVDSIAKVTLQKGESYSDWCRRPLTESQLRYAADDVRYLVVIRDKIQEELAVKGRLEWALDEMGYLEDASLYENDPSEAWRRVSGRGSLSGKQMAVLRELAHWREETAARRDIPRGWVVKDQTLIDVARRGPEKASDLKTLRGMAPKEVERSGREIIEAVRRGKEAPPLEGAKPPSRTAQSRARMISGLADAIIRSRCEAEGIAAELVSTRSDLEAMLIDVFSGSPDHSQHRLLQGWRKDLAGDAVLALAQGRVAVRSIDTPPYIEEVPL